ncbi:hypothetical protein OG401_03065 [Kitasatospora purpeofusca]|uniref:hypothetical protein n=1 Tax=Kitasatospora purpeofusca TaxID=67352 RepID=UPI00224E64D6|nr:hypothetical protein [Kitasatospora purpeofusca]MCX4683300.1 hypothetical protein [Kitasatospora purpeofusca]
MPSSWKPPDYGEPDDTAGADVLAAYREVRREVIAVQSGALHRLYENHRISDTTLRQLQRDLDLKETGLGGT